MDGKMIKLKQTIIYIYTIILWIIDCGRYKH